MREGDTDRNGQRAEGRRQQEAAHCRYGCQRRPGWWEKEEQKTSEDYKVVEAPIEAPVAADSAAYPNLRTQRLEDAPQVGFTEKVVDIPSATGEPLRMWKDEKIRESHEVGDDEANVLTERVTPFRMKNFSAQNDYEVLSSDGVKRAVECVAPSRVCRSIEIDSGRFERTA